MKPKVATSALTLASVTVVVLVVYFAAMAASSPLNGFFMFGELAALAATVVLGVIWFVRVRRRRAWIVAAEEKWRHFDEAKRTHRTTTEITVLSVDALEPTGSWITIKWNRFDHVQQAWIEALGDPIWPGAVVLISPDPSQVMPGAPWPATYFIKASSCLAWAPTKRPASKAVFQLSSGQ